MTNLGNDTGENIKEHNPDWQQVSSHSYRTLIAGCSESGKKCISWFKKSSTK